MSPLDELKQSFLAAREQALQQANPAPAAGRCRYCGKRWTVWAGSKLDGHSKCVVPASFKEIVRDTMWRHSLRFETVAEALGVSVAIVRSWVSPL